MTPQRIQLRRTKGWRLQDASRALNGLPAAKVDRSTMLGNPFTIFPLGHGRFEIVRLRSYGKRFGKSVTGLRIEIFEGTRGNALSRCVDLHAKLLTSPEGELLRRQARAALLGKNIACFCRLDQPCHADVLLEIANAPDRPLALESGEE